MTDLSKRHVIDVDHASTGLLCSAEQPYACSLNVLITPRPAMPAGLRKDDKFLSLSANPPLSMIQVLIP